MASVVDVMPLRNGADQHLMDEAMSQDHLFAQTDVDVSAHVGLLRPRPAGICYLRITLSAPQEVAESPEHRLRARHPLWARNADSGDRSGHAGGTRLATPLTRSRSHAGSTLTPAGPRVDVDVVVCHPVQPGLTHFSVDAGLRPCRVIAGGLAAQVPRVAARAVRAGGDVAALVTVMAPVVNRRRARPCLDLVDQSVRLDQSPLAVGLADMEDGVSADTGAATVGPACVWPT